MKALNAFTLDWNTSTTPAQENHRKPRQCWEWPCQKDQNLSRTRGRPGCSARDIGCETVNTCAGVPPLPPSSQAILSKLVSCYKPHSDLKLNIQKTKVMASSPITSWQAARETMETVTDFIFSGSKITVDAVCSHEIKRHLLIGRKAMTNLYSILKRRDITLVTKVPIVKAMVFPAIVYRCESWTIKKPERQRIVVLEKTLENPLDSKKIKPVNPKGNQAWIVIGRTDTEDETPILWPPDVKDWLIGKDPDAGKDWGQKEKGATKDEMVRWHHWLSGHELEQIWGASEGQGGLRVLQFIGSQGVRHNLSTEQQASV